MGGITRSELVFRAFKYTIYCLLAWNVFLFFREDLAASAQTFGDAITWTNFVEAYSATIDTLAWVILLLLFELETAVIDDDKLKGGLKWLFTGIRAVCYFFITWAFWGYCVKYGLVSILMPFTVADPCLLVGTDHTYIESLDEYLPITAENCAAFRGEDLVRLWGTKIIGTQAAAQAAIYLAITDIVNAGTWLIIVVLLELEVYLQLKDRLTDRMLRTGKYVKGFFYAILFLAAAYWGWKGDFLDFWDAFLWLVAFIFIELNVFHWHEEAEEEKKTRWGQVELG
ncbi:MAG: hypothetical protein R3348_00490 [Xanthomonadales bacterium]|nr:hypothetical protein [Xanthomonadales bacterium]